jgi:hypothetical protein
MTMERNKNRTKEIQEKMYKDYMREIKILEGKPREYWIKKANTQMMFHKIQ